MAEATTDAPVATGHCMKCKEKREMKDTEEVVMKNGRKAMKGICSMCGTKMFKILGK
ncbi:MAG: DUF5679 domain-containing protein [Candidatus Moraniibacteriota bacterium]